MPFGFHLTVDTLPSGCLSAESERRSRLGCIRRFQLRARLGASLFVLPGQRGITPLLDMALHIRAPVGFEPT